jgi:hypothetical protein|tara:strand:+ start:688 stop:972 length:285 start_codon:yes stop_codon:yes gene_type:complete
MKKLKSNQRLGTLTEKDINFPKWLTPEVVHTALYIHNAPSKEEIIKRTEYMAKQIGGEAMTYAMALLVLPTLMNNMQHSEEYKTWQEKRFKSLN